MTAFKFQQQLNRKWKTALVFSNIYFWRSRIHVVENENTKPRWDVGCFWRKRGIAIRKTTKKIYFIYWTFHSTFATSIGAKIQVKSSPHFTFAVCSFFLFIVEIPLLSLLEAAFFRFGWNEKKIHFKLENWENCSQISRIRLQYREWRNWKFFTVDHVSCYL